MRENAIRIIVHAELYAGMRPGKIAERHAIPIDAVLRHCPRKWEKMPQAEIRKAITLSPKEREVRDELLATEHSLLKEEPPEGISPTEWTNTVRANFGEL